MVAVGLVIAALNGLMYMGDDLRLLPGGFSLLYVLGGLPVAADGAWLLGLFGRGSDHFPVAVPRGGTGLLLRDRQDG